MSRDAKLWSVALAECFGKVCRFDSRSSGDGSAVSRIREANRRQRAVCQALGAIATMALVATLMKTWFLLKVVRSLDAAHN